MPEELKWRKIDDSDWLENIPQPERRRLSLIYARTYTIGQNFSYSITNQLIANFKKPVDRPPQELRYKKQAIQQFAHEVTQRLSQVQGWTIYLIPLPPSKSRDSLGYDDRVHDVARLVSHNLDFVECLPLLETQQDRNSLSRSGHNRSWEAVYRSLNIRPELRQYAQSISGSRVSFVFLDDILTSGATFYAAVKKLEDDLDLCAHAGIFWAKARRSE